MGILERLKSLSPTAIPEVFDVPTAEAILEDFPAKPEDRKAVLLLLGQGGLTAAQSVATVCVTAEGKVAEAAAWLLSEMKDRGVQAALRALDQDIDQESTARLLLAVVSGKTPASAVDVLIRQFKHKSPRVRRDALTALCQASRDAAETYVAMALSDADENVRIRALLLCANSGVGSEKIIPKAIALVSKDARGAPPQVVRAAIEVVVRRREANALSINDAETALLALATPIGALGRIFGKQNPPNAVWVTAIAALGRLGTQKAQKLLARLEKMKDPDVAGAARMALHPKSAGAPVALMPMVDSTVVTLSLDGRPR
jgi:HEAT repeat protein